MRADALPAPCARHHARWPAVLRRLFAADASVRACARSLSLQSASRRPATLSAAAAAEGARCRRCRRRSACSTRTAALTVLQIASATDRGGALAQPRPGRASAAFAGGRPTAARPQEQQARRRLSRRRRRAGRRPGRPSDSLVLQHLHVVGLREEVLVPPQVPECWRNGVVECAGRHHHSMVSTAWCRGHRQR